MPTLTYYAHRMAVQWMRGIATSVPSGLLVGVFTQAPNPDGTGIIEPTGGYTRRVITLTEAVVSAGVTTTQNTADIVFPTATANWPPVTYLGIFTQDGNLLAYGPLQAPRAIGQGDALAFAAGTIQLRLK